MASADFLVSTKRHDSAALLGYDVCKYIRCIIAGMTVFVKCPAIRKRLAHLIIHFQFTSGYNCCGTVKEKRIRVCRHSDCDRVGAQHSLSSEGRYHDRLGVGTCHSKKSFMAGHVRIISCNTEMIGISYTYDSHTSCLCLLNCLFHGKMADQLAHSVMSVYHSRNRCFKNNFRFRLGMNSPLLDSFMVTNHPLHSVALDPIQISSQKNIFNDASFFLRKAKRFKNVSAEMVQCVITPFYISHNRKSFLLIFPAGYRPRCGLLHILYDTAGIQ